MRGRVGMLGRAAVVDRERAHPRRASGLRHHAPMADDRAGAVSAAVKIQQHARRFAAGNDRPFAGHAVAIDRLAFDVGCHRPGRPDLVETLPPLRPADRPRLRAQQCADGVDLAVSQGAFSREGANHRTLIVPRKNSGRATCGPWPQKSCGQPLGEAWPRANRSGTGRGGDVTGSRVRKSLCCYRSRERRGGDRGAAVTERDPHIGIALRLTLDEAVAGIGPGQDGFVLVVENELALVALDGQHRVAFALLVAHHRDQQRLARPSGVDQHLALQKHVVFAVAVAVCRQRPFLDHTPVIHVGHRLDGLVDPLVDPHQIPPRRLRHHDVARLRGAAAALARLSAQNSTQPIGERAVSPRLA